MGPHVLGGLPAVPGREERVKEGYLLTNSNSSDRGRGLAGARGRGPRGSRYWKADPR
jgi:hypothetical protein